MMTVKQIQLDQLRDTMAGKNLPLKRTAHHLVFGKGNANAKIMFIGEAPGAHEDLKCIPFCGAAGKVLDKLLDSVDLTLNEVYITSIIKYRPPENRNPTLREIKRHTPFLIEQIKIISPRIIVTLGNFANKFVLSGFQADKMLHVPGISNFHGQVRSILINKAKVSLISLYHPAAALHNPNLHKVLRADFKAVKKVYRKLNY